MVANTGMAAISFGCCGARAYLDTFTPDIAIFAIPGAKLEHYTERIQTLAGANSTLRTFHQGRRALITAGGPYSHARGIAQCVKRRVTLHKVAARQLGRFRLGAKKRI
jgi:hypothetical protein